MNKLPEYFILNGKKFDILFGLTLLFGAPLVITMNDITGNLLVTGVCGFAIYIIEAWAFRYKVTSCRVRAVKRILATSNADKQLPHLPLVIIVGRFLRHALRVLVFMISLFSLHDYFFPEVERMNDTAGKTFTLISVLTEIGLYRLTRFNQKGKKDKQGVTDEWEWRSRYSDFLNDASHGYKEAAANVILLITGLMFTHSYWHTSMKFFENAIRTSYVQGVNAGGLLWTIFITTTWTAILVLFPSRLAWWTEEVWNAQDSSLKKRVRWTMWVAYLGIVAPVYYYFIRVYW